jgi:hypothetical protein
MHFLSYLKGVVPVEKAILDTSAAEPNGAISFWHIPAQRGKK